MTSAPNQPTSLPNASQQFNTIWQEIRGKNLFLFLDFDGTLAPIVPDPEDAGLSERGRSILQKLATQVPVAILSGRDRTDVAKKIGLDNLVYAGSHGFDITGPNNLEMQYEGGVEALPDLGKAHKRLEEKLEHIEGAWAERKKFAIAVHYRHTPEDRVSEVESEVKKAVADSSKLKLVGGKKIFELKPNFDWHKGRALEWLLNELAEDKNTVPIFIGDDVTDEDALKVIHQSGIGILAGDHGDKTWARYIVADTIEVEDFLQKLSEAV
jgi:alpha,alpha-trehalase